MSKIIPFFTYETINEPIWKEPAKVDDMCASKCECLYAKNVGRKEKTVIGKMISLCHATIVQKHFYESLFHV